MHDADLSDHVGKFGDRQRKQGDFEVAALYALFVREHTFLQQVDSLRNATAETGDLHDFYNISHNNRLSGPSGTCGGRAFRPFFRRKKFFSTEKRKQLFFNALNFRGGGLKKIFY